MNQPEWHDMGPLHMVVERALVEGRVALAVSLHLTFEAGSALFSAVAEDDTLALTSPAPESEPHDPSVPDRSQDITNEEPWGQVIGRPVLWGRLMENHHGYVDGYQLEFATGHAAVGRCVDLVVVASSIRTGSTSFS